MAKNPTDKFPQKQTALIERTAKSFNISHEEARSLLNVTRKQSVRINTLKISIDDALEQLSDLGVKYESVPWMSDGVFVSDGIEKVRDHEATTKGYFYIQNAASWLPALTLEAKPGDIVLDMCAAPGGKTSHIAQLASNQALITANDNSRPRLHKLQNNLERLGVENATYLLHDATRLAQKLGEGQFDAILLDAPCSGEGMMQLDSRKDFESWSVAHIKRLQQLQKKLIVQAWKLLKPGGTLVYSTCTMAPEENEAVIEYLLKNNEDVHIDDLAILRNQLANVAPSVLEWNDKRYHEEIAKTLRLYPSENVEAFFVAKLVKSNAAQL